jgi:hypothetical protein
MHLCNHVHASNEIPCLEAQGTCNMNILGVHISKHKSLHAISSYSEANYESNDLLLRKQDMASSTLKMSDKSQNLTSSPYLSF